VTGNITPFLLSPIISQCEYLCNRFFNFIFNFVSFNQKQGFLTKKLCDFFTTHSKYSLFIQNSSIIVIKNTEFVKNSYIKVK